MVKSFEEVIYLRLSKHVWVLMVSAFIVGFWTHSMFSCSRPQNIEVVEVVDNVIYVTEPEMEFSPENLKQLLKDLNVKFPHIVYAQAIEETGFFTSMIFRENNNLFGMKRPMVRQTTAIGSNRGHATYSNWISSVKDYAMWQSNMANGINSEREYLLLLGRVYAENPNYVRNINRIVMNNELLAYF